MQRLPDLEAWAIFAKVAETGSFARAAAELALSKATVSKAVSRLEQRVGASLMHRTSRRLSLTDIGREAAAGAARMLAEADALESEALAGSSVPSGLVRAAGPMSFGVAHVAPFLPELLELYPKIEIDLHLSDATVDLVGDGFDLALRIGALADSSLRARRICQVRRIIVASPAYLARAGIPAEPRDLANHACLGYAYLQSRDRWRFTHVSGETQEIVTSGRLRANNADALLPALRAGLGIAVMPEFTIAEDLASGRAQAIMTDWSPPPTALNIVTPPGPLRPARVEAVIDFLAGRLASTAWAVAAAPAERAVG